MVLILCFLLNGFQKSRDRTEFIGDSIYEKGIDKANGKTIIEIDPKYFRPTEVDLFLGGSSKAREILR